MCPEGCRSTPSGRVAPTLPPTEGPWNQAASGEGMKLGSTPRFHPLSQQQGPGPSHCGGEPGLALGITSVPNLLCDLGGSQMPQCPHLPSHWAESPPAPERSEGGEGWSWQEAR